MSDSPEESILFPNLSLFEEPKHEPEPKPRPGAWARAKIGTFQSRLEAVKARHRDPRTLTRLLVGLTNDAFGFNGWSSSIVDCDLVDELSDHGMYIVRQKAVVRITLMDGTYVEAAGTGISELLPRAVSYQVSKRMAVSNGLRNAIMLFAELVQ